MVVLFEKEPLSVLHLKFVDALLLGVVFLLLEVRRVEARFAPDCLRKSYHCLNRHAVLVYGILM